MPWSLTEMKEAIGSRLCSVSLVPTASALSSANQDQSRRDFLDVGPFEGTTRTGNSLSPLEAKEVLYHAISPGPNGLLRFTAVHSKILNNYAHHYTLICVHEWAQDPR
uniref:Uncharacterized protein n=1 Tax=Moniliophthora roreri TaxID=221103 RepID=A0A0W0FMS8_MONRR